MSPVVRKMRGEAGHSVTLLLASDIGVSRLRECRGLWWGLVIVPRARERVTAEVLVLPSVTRGKVVEEEEYELSECLGWDEFEGAWSQFEREDSIV